MLGMGEKQECKPCAIQFPNLFLFLSSQNFYLDVDAAGTALDSEEVGHAGSTHS